ncbi:3-galactosyl-N-acetylglucosaminide 4-alpha-L-fucosyltransferase FUT3-like [Latimeria chalumnae]|uniref:3-galactosyl-N-acetylglucosaminide 4-alpha-L-fucosyltransferase FUT3-like n=1 Tax=Latimeria chalumnae TaxID=7897 RepID=UPI0003C187F8|nr:PREDICTED: galactoside 3(4)-L-fucosyltransferase-like [Latimeria chalumnae]|eukprot:XP_005988092.1 PREDICTED: galactoside 3(4)-L-fucosyltransferase-like [Latimeria chalumnae]
MSLVSCLSQHHKPSSQLSLQQNRNDKTTEQLLILLWTWPSGEEFPLGGCDDLYNIPDCNFTTDRSQFSMADAVIVHHHDNCKDRKSLPQDPRPFYQRWIWFNLESPSNSPNLEFMNNLFNLTMSYKVGSDIFTPHAFLHFTKEQKNYTIPKKSKLVAWIISNWDPSSARVKYYQDLRQHIDIDVYGKQHVKLERADTISVISEYKFYLAFENSVHTDYLTETLWSKAFKSGAVPVVLGLSRENYEKFVPSDSFIHINDFKSSEELAKHLKFLDQNEEEYKKYFTWRKYIQIQNSSLQMHYCKACQFLRKNKLFKTVKNLSNWFTK